jgi:hypothetical protein
LSAEDGVGNMPMDTDDNDLTEGTEVTEAG